MAITIIGLGPGDPALLTRRAWDIISKASDIYVRTARHPTLEGLPASVNVHSFDHIYEQTQKLRIAREAGRSEFEMDIYFGRCVDVALQVLAEEIFELFPCPLVDDEVTREVLAFAQLRASEAGAAFLTALLTPMHARHISRFGFLRVPERVNPRRWYLGARCAPADEALLREIGNWYVTYGDADIL